MKTRVRGNKIGRRMLTVSTSKMKTRYADKGDTCPAGGRVQPERDNQGYARGGRQKERRPRVGRHDTGHNLREAVDQLMDARRRHIVNDASVAGGEHVNVVRQAQQQNEPVQRQPFQSRPPPLTPLDNNEIHTAPVHAATNSNPVAWR